MKGTTGVSRAGLGVGLVLGFLAASSVSAASTDSMTVGRQTSQPIGHYEFCKANPRECSIRPRGESVLALTDDVWKLINDVNMKVNEAVAPEADIDNYGLDEVWTYPDNGRGDCEDYALEKRRQLSEDGISLADLLMTVVRKPDGEGHAVLTVRTDKGDYILDNLSQEVKPWRETGYKYLKRQASYNTGRWVSLIEDNNPLVGSLK